MLDFSAAAAAAVAAILPPQKSAAHSPPSLGLGAAAAAAATRRTQQRRKEGEEERRERERGEEKRRNTAPEIPIAFATQELPLISKALIFLCQSFSHGKKITFTRQVEEMHGIRAASIVQPSGLGTEPKNSGCVGRQQQSPRRPFSHHSQSSRLTYRPPPPRWT